MKAVERKTQAASFLPDALEGSPMRYYAERYEQYGLVFSRDNRERPL